MFCLICQLEQNQEPAIAACTQCQSPLCAKHLDEFDGDIALAGVCTHMYATV
jgi:hypothetical protein